MSFKTKTIKDLKSKKGTFISKGSDILATYDQNKRAVMIEESDKIIYIPASKAYNYLNGFKKEPSITTMEKWANDGIAKTIIGTKIEPDGYDNKGMPSWFIVVGII